MIASGILGKCAHVLLCQLNFDFQVISTSQELFTPE